MGPRIRGTKVKKTGVAEYITKAAHLRKRRPRLLRSPPTLSIAQMVSRTGRREGRFQKSNGAVLSMGKDVPRRPVAEPHRRHSTAMQVSGIGRTAGLSPNRNGAVRTLAKAARVFSQVGVRDLKMRDQMNSRGK